MAEPGKTQDPPHRQAAPAAEGSAGAAAGAPSRSAVQGRKRLRISIFLKLATLVTVVALIPVAIISTIVLDRQKSQFLSQLIQVGEHTARIVARNGADKLLVEDDLALFQLMSDVVANEQVVFALVTDHKGIIRAHSNIDEVGKPYRPDSSFRTVKEDANVRTGVVSLNGEDILLFDAPVTFRNLVVGGVKIGISLRQIAESAGQARRFIVVLAVAITIGAILLSLVLSLYFTFPIHALGEATRAVAEGELSHRVRIARNDELGDLAKDFNKMAHELEVKETIKSSFGRYVTPEIVEMILDNPESIWMKGGEVEASVLFVDIRGFTSLCEERNPEHLVALLNGYFTRVTEAVVRHGGHLNKFIGDEAMAVFGAPVPKPFHADAAVRAALEIHREMGRFVPQSGSWEAPVQVGIGVNSGKMIAGNLGSPRRMEYTVVGDNVNVASRLTSLAGGGEIVISKNTYDLLTDRDAFALQEKGRVSVRGRKTRLTIYKVEADSCGQEEGPCNKDETVVQGKNGAG